MGEGASTWGLYSGAGVALSINIIGSWRSMVGDETSIAGLVNSVSFSYY